MARPRENPRAPAAGFPIQPQARGAGDACFSSFWDVGSKPVRV